MPITGVGRLVGELGLDIGRFEDGLRRAGSRLDNNLKGWEQRTRQIGDRLGAIGKTLSLRLTAPILGLGAAGIALVNRLGNAANQMLALRDAFGLSIEFIQGIRGAAIEAGVPWESLQNVFRRVAELLREVGSQDDVPEVFNELGVAVFDADGKLRSMETIFLELIEALSQIDNPLERAQKGTELFGDEWIRIAPLIAFGRTEVERLIEETDKVPESTLEATSEAATQWEQLKLQLETLLIQGLTPVVQAFIELPKPIQGAIAASIGFLAILGPLLIGIKALSVALLFLAANPIVLLIAAIAAAIVIGTIMFIKYDEISKAAENDWRLRFLLMSSGVWHIVTAIKEAIKWIERLKTVFNAVKNNLPEGFFGRLLSPFLSSPGISSSPVPGTGSLGVASASASGSGNIIIQGDILDGDHFLRLVGQAGTRIINGGGWNKLQRR